MRRVFFSKSTREKRRVKKLTSNSPSSMTFSIASAPPSIVTKCAKSELAVPQLSITIANKKSEVFKKKLKCEVGKN